MEVIEYCLRVLGLVTGQRLTKSTSRMAVGVRSFTGFKGSVIAILNMTYSRRHWRIQSTCRLLLSSQNEISGTPRAVEDRLAITRMSGRFSVAGITPNWILNGMQPMGKFPQCCATSMGSSWSRWTSSFYVLLMISSIVCGRPWRL